MAPMIEVHRVKTEEEYSRCLAVRRQVFIEEQGVSPKEEIDEFEGESVHFLALLDGEPVGTGRFRIKKHYLKFERIATLKSIRGKGVGRAIMQKMQCIGQKEYPEYTMAMHAQLSALPFYEKLGWIPQKEIFDEAGIPHQVMFYKS